MNGPLAPHYTVGRKEFQPFFDKLMAGSLAFPFCRSCSKFHWYPMRVCKFCGSTQIEWRTISGEARLFSWTVVRFRFGRHIPHELPYIVALVEFDDAPGVRLITNLVGVDADLLKEGLALTPKIVAGKPPRVEFSPPLRGV